MSKLLKRLNSLLFFVFIALPLYAEDLIPGEMNTLAQKFVAAFRSPFVTTILVIAFLGCVVTFGIFRESDKLKRGAIAIGVTIVLIGITQKVVETVWASAMVN
jgi:hypothetical protein